MPIRHTHLVALLCCVGLQACTTRPLQPSPPLYTLWKKPGVSEQGVRGAMLDCGFTDSAHVTRVEMSTNDMARAELCMIDRGFAYQDRAILCAHAPELPACANVPRGKTFGTDADFDPALPDRRPARPPAYALWSRAGSGEADVRQAMTACGYASVTRPEGVMTLNDAAAAQLCMIDRGFRYAQPATSLLCRNPPALPACRDRKIDVQSCCAPAKAVGQR